MRRRRLLRAAIVLCPLAGVSGCGASDPRPPAVAPVKPAWAESARALVVGSTPKSATVELDVTSEWPARFDDVKERLRYPRLTLSAPGARITRSELLETVPFTGGTAVDGGSSDTSSWRYAYRLTFASPTVAGTVVRVRGCLPVVGCSTASYALSGSRRIQYPPRTRAA